MDEDIRFPIYCLGATGATAPFTFVCPYKCTIRDLIGAVSADPGDGETITVTNNTQSDITMGVITWGSDIAANAKGTWAADSTYGNTVCEAGDVLVFTVSQCSAAATFSLILELDPKCRVP